MRYISWQLPCCRHNQLQFVRSCPSWTRPNFVPMATPNFDDGVLLFHVTCWMFFILQLTYFLPFFFSDLALCQLQRLSQLQLSPVPLHFPLPDVATATDATPTFWPFFFQGSVLPLPMSGSWPRSMCWVHIAIQEFQAVALMLWRLAFQFSGRVVALQFNNSPANVFM